MEIYDSLYESIKTHVHKMHMKHNVLPEIKNCSYDLCANCAFHGFPCLNCAYYQHRGKLGPGFCLGKRTMISDELDTDDEEINFNMLLFILTNETGDMRILRNISDHSMLPQEETYLMMHN